MRGDSEKDRRVVEQSLTPGITMTVSDLIKLLHTFPPEMQVAYYKYSEQCLMKAEEIGIKELCMPRPDGWLQDKRPDIPTMKYLLFPGN